MKEPPLRKTSALQGGLPANRRVQEITVVQHYHPNPMRPKMGNFPEVHFNELPDGSRYLHLHPVFKFVDNFLSSTSVTSKSVPGGRQHIATKKRSPGKLVRNCECTPNDIVNNVGGDSVAKAFITKKSKMPHRTSNQNLLKNFKQERMKTNLSNMSSKSNIRVSLRGAPCMNWSRCGDNAPVHKNIEKTERSANSMGKGSEYYIEQLKNEIKESNSRTQFCRMTPRNDNYEYVDKLKDELSCTQSRCLEDARKIIDELKTEIVNYRLHAKTKYSSSCSDIASSEKALQSTIISGHKMGEYPPVERSEIYDKQGDVPHPSARDSPTRDLTQRCRPCETLWQSKGSLPSSSDLEMVPVAQDINFEEKLEEANSLIEKVRKALKDIGKGIYKVPEHKRAHGDADEPARQCSENVRCVDMVCSFHGQCRTLVNQNGEAVKEKKTVVAKEQIQESKAQTPQADTKSDVRIEGEEKQQIREEVAREKQQIREEGVKESITPDRNVEEEAAQKHVAKPVNDEGKESPRDTSGEEFVVKKTEDKKFVTPSIEMLQEKLQAISEVSESDASTEKPVEQKRPVPRMERGSSPIDLTRGKVEAGDEVNDPNAGSPNRHSFVQTWTEGTVTHNTQQPFLQLLQSDTTISESSRSVAELASGIKKNASGSEVNSSAPEGTQSPDAAKTYESGSSSRRGSNQRSSKLSIQMMPPVNIRGGLVMQRTLNLCIKPTGSVTNDLSVDQGNIGYEEITTDGAGEKWAEPEKSIFVKCPDDCKNPTTEYCKYKSAEYEDVDLNNGTNEIKEENENTNEVLSRCSEETDGVVLIKPAMSNASREKPRSSHQETCSGRTPKITPSGGLNEDALLLFRSFQILDDERYQNRRESQFSLATLTQNIARSVLNTDPVNTPQKRLEQLARIENASETLRLAMSESSAVPTIYTAPSDSQRVNKIIHVGHRTPWEIGFYQTKSTQCSQTYLAPKETSVAKSNPVPVAQPNPVPVAKPKSAEALTRTSSADEMPKTSTAEASPVSGSASSSPRSSTASQPVTSPDRTPLSRSHYSDESTSRSSEPTPVTKNTDHVQSTDPVLPTNDEIREQPVKDITQHRSPHHHQISMADILSILKGGKENANVSVSGSMDNASFMSKQHKTSVTVTPTADGTILRSNESSKDEIGKSSPNNKSSLLALPVANTEDNAKSAHNSTSSSSNDSVTKGSVIHGTPTTMSKKSAKEFSSSSSTSSSSSNADVHKSVHSSSAETMTHTQNGVKRKHTSDSGVHDDSVKTVQSIRDEEKRSVPYVKTDSLEKENDVEVKEPKPKHKEPAVDVEHEVSKETKPADPKVQKVDANLQVSLDSSTGSASSSDTSFYSHRERLNTIAYFIKGLTGTSQDELDKLRSNPSFPKTDLPNWSKTVLKTLQEQNALPRPSLMSDKTKEEMSKRSMYEVTRERVMDTTDYGDRSGGESKQRQPEDAESVLSDNTKMKRLREFQKFAQQAQGKASRDTKASKSKVVMTVAEEIGDVGEKSDDLVSYSKRNLPFYRRVLGRILEPSNRKPMQTSQSDANPVDESVSEGEIKCKSSASIGEVAPRKYPNERKKSGKGGVKYLKKHPEDLIRKELSDKSLRIARQRTQYNNWVTYYLQKHNNMPLIDDSSSMSPDSSKK